MRIILAQFRAQAFSTTKDQEKQNIVPREFIFTNKCTRRFPDSDTYFFRFDKTPKPGKQRNKTFLIVLSILPFLSEIPDSGLWHKRHEYRAGVPDQTDQA